MKFRQYIFTFDKPLTDRQEYLFVSAFKNLTEPIAQKAKRSALDMERKSRVLDVVPGGKEARLLIVRKLEDMGNNVYQYIQFHAMKDGKGCDRVDGDRTNYEFLYAYEDLDLINKKMAVFGKMFEIKVNPNDEKRIIEGLDRFYWKAMLVNPPKTVQGLVDL